MKDNQLFKRREVKPGKPIPKGFVQADFDAITGKTVGWMPVTDADKWHKEAWAATIHCSDDGTYELLGPKIQGNPEKFSRHILVKHSRAALMGRVPRSFKGIAEWLGDHDVEGIVFHHADGRMAKIKKRDFGLRR